MLCGHNAAWTSVQVRMMDGQTRNIQQGVSQEGTMAVQEQIGTFVPADEGKRVSFLGQLFTYKVLGESDAVSIFELVTPPQNGAAPHLHPKQDETHYILAGEYTFMLAGREVSAGPGSIVFVPKGTVHAFTNVGSQDGTILFIETPAGPLEQWLLESGEAGGEANLAQLIEAGKRSGAIEFVVLGQAGS